MTRSKKVAFATVWLMLILGLAGQASAQLRDGKLFDMGASMTAPAESAPADLRLMAPRLGRWRVELERYGDDAKVVRATGVAALTYMNRGHAVMERIRFADVDGGPRASMAFFSVHGAGVWTVGEGDSWSEAITLWSGAAADGTLRVHDAGRPGGGATLSLRRRVYGPVKTVDGVARFEMESAVSTDVGTTWKTVAKRIYTRLDADDEPFPLRDDFGLPDPERVAEASQFDFLIGDFEAVHWLKRPDRELRWTANATAVHVLDGHAVLEFNWHDNDPTLPDSATSILRIYNRSMRRWENLYLPNRSNVPLYFGGVKEGERIVLHPFAAQTGGYPLSQWIFFDVQEDGYRWKGLRAADRSKPFEPVWTIDFTRKTADENQSVSRRSETKTGSDSQD